MSEQCATCGEVLLRGVGERHTGSKRCAQLANWRRLRDGGFVRLDEVERSTRRQFWVLGWCEALGLPHEATDQWNVHVPDVDAVLFKANLHHWVPLWVFVALHARLPPAKMRWIVSQLTSDREQQQALEVQWQLLKDDRNRNSHMLKYLEALCVR